MADGNLGAKEIVLDITGVVTARVIRAFPQVVKINRIKLVGTAPAVGENGNLVLRKTAAGTGEVVWRFDPTDSQRVSDTFEVGTIVNGLYMDAFTGAWNALPATGNAYMIIYTA